MKIRVLAGERIEGQTIVLTGAIVPHTFGSSDGSFNIGGAPAFARSLPEGVDRAMNGRGFGRNHSRKDRPTGRFEECAERQDA